MITDKQMHYRLQYLNRLNNKYNEERVSKYFQSLLKRAKHDDFRLIFMAYYDKKMIPKENVTSSYPNDYSGESPANSSPAGSSPANSSPAGSSPAGSSPASSGKA